ALAIARWHGLDIVLWYADNVLHVVDFVDAMETFDIRLHTLPRAGLTAVLTFLCRVWVGIGIGYLAGKKKRQEMRPGATPADAAFVPFWARQSGVLVGVCGALLAAALIGQAAAGRPGPRLAAAVSGGSESHAAAALSALRRMGPTAADTIPTLVEARSQA